MIHRDDSFVRTPPRSMSPEAGEHGAHEGLSRGRAATDSALGSPGSVWGSPLQHTPPPLAATSPRGHRPCVPLLKFNSNSKELPHLDDEGLATLAALPPPVSIVTFLGDGRCGKSTLASRLVSGEGDGLVFPVGDTGEPVTAGIDLCVVPTWAGQGSLVVLDCEGGNNPTGAIRSAVDLVAMLGSTLTVQVVWGQMGEGQLQQIGQGLAARDRLISGANAGLPTQRLLLVVNGCHLRYSSGHLAKTFLEVHTGSESARNELRANIKRAYEQIHFVTVPHEMDPAFRDKAVEFQRAVAEHCSPAALAGTRLSGAQVAEMLRLSVAELHSSGAVPVPSVFRHVIFDNMLMPLVNKLVADVESTLPDLDDGEYRPSPLDCRPEAMERFDEDSKHLTHAELVGEARKDLREKIDRLWLHFSTKNEAIGEQDRDVTTEFETRYSHSEERVVSWKRPCIILGKRRPVVQACNIFRVWTRTRVLKKNGQIAYSDWAPSTTISGAAENLHSYDGSGWADRSMSSSCSPPMPLYSPSSRRSDYSPRPASAPPSLQSSLGPGSSVRKLST